METPKNPLRTALASLIVALSPLDALALNGDNGNGNGHSNGSRLSSRSSLSPEISPFLYDPKTGEFTPSNYAQVLPHDSDLYNKIRSMNIGKKTPLLDSAGKQILAIAAAAGGIYLVTHKEAKYGVALLLPVTAIGIADLSARRNNATLSDRMDAANGEFFGYNDPLSMRNRTITRLRTDEAADYELKRDLYERIDELNNGLEKLTWEMMKKNGEDAGLRDRLQTRLWKLKGKAKRIDYEDMASELEGIEPDAQSLMDRYTTPEK